MKERETKQNNRMFRSDSNRNEANWSETKQNETNYEVKLRNMAVGFTSIPNEAKKLMRNKAKRNKLQSETSKNNHMFRFTLSWSKTIEAKQSETSKFFLGGEQAKHMRNGWSFASFRFEAKLFKSETGAP